MSSEQELSETGHGVRPQKNDEGLQDLPSDCRPFDGISPYGYRKRKLYIRQKDLDRATKIGPGRVKELAYTLIEAAAAPKGIFKGVRDEGEEDWFCYSASPSYGYDYRTGERRVWPGKVFVIIVDEFFIHQWSGWVKADQAKPNLPENFDSRFDEVLMP